MAIHDAPAQSVALFYGGSCYLSVIRSHLERVFNVPHHTTGISHEPFPAT